MAAHASAIAAIYLARESERFRLALWKTSKALQEARDRADRLLEAILPEDVIPRLKEKKGMIADRFQDVTVVFADIVDFTPLSERLGPERMFSLLNQLFGLIDEAATRYGVEKIETAGDGYLAVGNAPGKLPDHPKAVASFALEVIEAARVVSLSSRESIRIRVGIHCGPVMAGIVGSTRYHYQMIGSTVNIASRVQSVAQPGEILLSAEVFPRLQEDFVCEDNGLVELKGYGPMHTWRVVSRT